MHFRKPESFKTKLDTLIKQYGSNRITIEHGCGCYEFNHYEFEAPNWKNNWESAITIYVVDFWNGKIIEFGRYTKSQLSKPTEYDYDKVYTRWDKEFPTIIEINEYK